MARSEEEHERLGRFVYVIQGDPGTPIKVGIARDPVARLKGLQTGNPQQLRLLAVVPGDHEVEAGFHKRLKAMALYDEKREIPTLPVVKKRIQRSGFGPDRGWGRTQLGHRWRTQGDKEPNPVTVRFVDPKTIQGDNPPIAGEEAEWIRESVRLKSLGSNQFHTGMGRP